MRTLLKDFADWFDDRTGYRRLTHDLLYERIPGGARWRYVFGSILAVLFLVQVITGLFLWAAYSPSAQTAWESVYYIQYEMQAGWLLRSIHHFAAQAMVVMLAVHMLQVVWCGAYRPPREINWWIGLLLMLLVLGLSLTGYLLPWDQKGYWATQVATKIAGITPIVGPYLQELIVGGSTYGHHTLTRFFALHAGWLPILLTLLLVVHLALFRRHGVTAPENAVGEQFFWPHQALLDSIASLVVLAAVMFLVWRSGGADLGAPADPAEPYSAARPEWYFLFLFQFLKYFPGPWEVVGAIVIPGLIFVVLVALPWMGRPQWGHGVAVTLVIGVLGGIGFLTYAALAEDRANRNFQSAVAEAEESAERAIELAQLLGIPEGGAVDLLRRDPWMQGPELFSQHCASCHRWGGVGHERVEFPPTEPTASNLFAFGREPEKWIRGFLQNPVDPHFFGRTKFKDGTMVQWAGEHISKATEEELDAIVALLMATPEQVSAQAAIIQGEQPAEAVSGKNSLVRRGLEVFLEGFAKDQEDFEAGLLLSGVSCNECHRIGPFEGLGTAPGPDLTGYATQEWLRGMVENPAGDRYYGERNDRMPAFEERLTAEEIDLIVRWIKGDWPRSSGQ